MTHAFIENPYGHTGLALQQLGKWHLTNFETRSLHIFCSFRI